MVANEKQEGKLRVVAFGASAGGLQALRPIVGGLEPNGATTYVVAHHMSPHHPSSLADILAANARLQVSNARHGDRLLADRLYVCPPGHDLEIVDDHLALWPRADSNLIAPSIDRLFRSLAESQGARAVGVVLSGSGHDGTAGAAAINAVAGTVIVQMPEEAVQPSMPESIILSGFADLVGNGEQITAWLNQLDKLNDTQAPAPADTNNPSFRELFGLVTGATGLDVGQYKENTLRRQTVRRYRNLNLPSLEQYLAYVREHPEELLQLQQSFMISVSSFFRDPLVFEALEKVLRKLVAGKQPGDSVRVWVPGCATGEEAYSIAIVLAEILGDRLNKFEVRIFATDIDQDALDFARAGVYSAADLAKLDTPRRQCWFTPEGSSWRIGKTIRELCVFSAHDIIAHPPFIKMELVSCRNLLIYFKPEQQADLINTFHYGLNPDGILLLGKSESPGFNSRLFEAIDEGHKLYRRRGGTASHTVRFTRPGAPVSLGRQLITKAGLPSQRQSLVDATQAAIAREYGPPGVLVNASFEPLHFFGSSQRYFALPEDTADFSVFALCLPELRNELKALCYRLIQEKLPVLDGFPVELPVNGESVRVRPVLRRIERSPENGEPAFLICFEESRSPAAPLPTDATSDRRFVEETVLLRQELADTREHLQAVIEELEASNEELQSLNEEVQSSSEELQASNEELQSSNEELTTLNDELRIKSQEALQLTTTVSNIQNSIRTSLVVLDREGRITRYNPLATRVFGLVANDIGQALYGIPCHLHLPRLREQVGDVIASGLSLVERVHQGDFHFLMQIDPYLNEIGENAGAVLTFADISELYQAEQAQKSSELRSRHVWQASLEGLLVVDASGCMLEANPALAAMFGYDVDELVGRPVESLVPESLRTHHAGLRGAFMAAPRTRRMAQLLDIRGCRKDGSEFFVEISLSSMSMLGEGCVLATVSDVTERKLAEVALREREERLSAIIRHSPSALSLKSPDGRYALANPNLQRIHHVAEADIVGKTDFDLYPEETALAFRANDQRILAGEARLSIEEIVPVDGEPRTYVSHMFPIQDEVGTIQYICRISLDVTERKAAERALRQSEQRLRLAQDAARAGTWEWHLDSNQNFWSDEIWNLYGLQVGQVAPSFEAWQKTIAPEDRARTVATITDAASRAAEFETEWQVRLPEGEPPRWLMSRGRPILGPDGKPSHYIGIVIDISERKRAETELTQYRNELEELVTRRTRELSDLYNNAPCGYHSLNKEGVFVNINETELRWLGYTREEIVGRRRAIDLMPPHCHPVFAANFAKLLETGQLTGVEFDFVRKDGTLLPVLLNSKAVFDADGQLLHTLSTIIDNTDRKLAEQAWTAAREAAETANRAKSAFLANMSHEIRTPLNAIVGFSHLVKRGKLQDNLSEKMDKINGAAQHLLSIINDILDLSKIEAEKLVLEETAFDLLGVAANVVSMLHDRFTDKNLALKVECDPFSYQVIGDPTRFTQACLNLASNAVKFTQAGTITLRIQRQEERGDHVLIRVEVEDHGVGIAAEILPRLFSPFEQGDASQTRKQGGTGLGLAITKRLAVLMGGDAGASSEIGVGSTFWFTAWLGISSTVVGKPVDAASGETIEATLRRDYGGTPLLLVEDEPINQEIARMFLEDVGLQVTLAPNGAVAVDLARQREFSMVLMDLQMPEVDGLEATRRIRALPGWNKVPIIAMTANAFAEDRDHCLAAGMDDFITKPFNPDKFFATLHRWLVKAKGGNITS